mmetsp:Transcript_55194/g.76540  ORF Transcript_55194/g.76540 Transcript_55194/m.76540 type:complete len:532 (+) Transcript_55194:78-1673(+)
MSTLAGLLPKPVHSKSKWDDDDSDLDDDSLMQEQADSAVSTSGNISAPPYGRRNGWVPRNSLDFGDGGAYPECHVAQFPLSMGDPKAQSSGAIVPLSLNKDGKVQYDQLLRQGQGKDKVIHSTYDALVPVQISHEDPKRDLPDEEEVLRQTEATKKALGLLVDDKIAAAQTSRVTKQNAEPTYVRYTSQQQGSEFNSGAQQRIIRMVDVQKDPMEPPKFKTNKKIPRGPPSPPAPVMHSPPRKVTAEEQQNWKIPPCVSSWKNQKGYTIPLDKRMAADGRGLQDVSINDKFAKFSEALFIGERLLREGINAREKIKQKAANVEKERKEEELRRLAQATREERAGIKPAAHEAEEVAERDQLRYERSRERERERRIAAAAPDKRDRLSRNRERDVSEQIALGMPAKSASAGGFDSRLFNQSQGMDSGFKGDDAYDVYDKAFRGEKSSSIYRPTKRAETQYTDDEVEALKSGSKFHRPDKGFQGADGRQQRDGPVQFEKSESDVFGLDQFLADAKGSRKRTADDNGGDAKRRR